MAAAKPLPDRGVKVKQSDEAFLHRRGARSMLVSAYRMGRSRMLTAEPSCRRYRSPSIVSVASLIPLLEPCLQLEQAKPGDRSAEK
jgi:hypothetical protein